jgi:hypothetical protein
MMSPDDFAAIQRIVQDAMQNAEFINKVWIASAAVMVSIFAAVVASTTQMLVARWQRKTQLKLADQQALQQKLALSEQISMQELASRRIAIANISAKRQNWIDELRQDISKYLCLWQEISYRWDAVVSEERIEPISDGALKEFKLIIAGMRMEALELQLRIALRLNITESDHQDLKMLMGSLEATTIRFQRTVSKESPELIQKDFKAIHQSVISKAQKILKDEWDRLKLESYADPYEPSSAKAPSGETA